MYEPILQLEDVNSKCRIQLTKTLSTRHGVRIVAGRGEFTEDGCRGLAYFLAFDPWQTCLRFPPGSARFFDAAEKVGVLSNNEAALLSRSLVTHGAEMATLYRGTFSPFFSQPRVKTILSNVDDLDHLSESGLAIGGSWADRLLETSPIPLQPSKNLEMQSFRQLSFEGEIEIYSKSPWLAWVEALDLICVGPWIGLKAPEIMRLVAALREKTIQKSEGRVEISANIVGQKVQIPLLSRGLQGAVVGIFTDVPKAEREPIITSLLQFGESLSDIYADLRWKHFIDALDGELDEHALAREVINVISPVGRIIVSFEGRRAGFKLGYEMDYWSGYHALTPHELDEPASPVGFAVAGPNGASIFIEPLTNIVNLNADFTRLRIENFLNQTFGSISPVRIDAPLSLRDIQQLRSTFEAYADGENTSLAKLRQYYVVSKVESHWENGTVKVSNSELKRFLESELGREVKNGYQVTSFAPELEKIFGSRMTVAKTRNALSLSWVRGA